LFFSILTDPQGWLEAQKNSYVITLELHLAR